MDAATAKERAKASAQAKYAQQKGARVPLSQRQGRTDGQGNQLTFFAEDAAGLKLSPQTVMMICLLYIGCVVGLHIMSKVQGKAAPQAPADM